MRRRIIVLVAVLSILATICFAACTERSDNEGETDMYLKIYFEINGAEIAATPANTKAAAALIDRLKQGDVTIETSDYGGFEKVGRLGFRLPAEDERITTEPCEFVLYQGNQLVIFYGTNSWSYTRLGKLDISESELKQILGKGNLTVTLHL